MDNISCEYKNKNVGERFDFGRYPQGANGEIKPITWLVLQRESDGLLVVAEYGLDCKPYNEELRPVTWANCSLRRWLNGEFFNTAFTAHERSLIKMRINTDINEKDATEDRVFLLSEYEADLFSSHSGLQDKPTDFVITNGKLTYVGDEDNICIGERFWILSQTERQAKPTPFALKNGVWTYSGEEEYRYRGNCVWWLRTHDQSDDRGICVDDDGSIFCDSGICSDSCLGTDINSNLIAVRPALKIAI